MRDWTGGKAPKRQSIWENVICSLFATTQTTLHVHLQSTKQMLHFFSERKKII